jgi:hypothetical protein
MACVRIIPHEVQPGWRLDWWVMGRRACCGGNWVFVSVSGYMPDCRLHKIFQIYFALYKITDENPMIGSFWISNLIHKFEILIFLILNFLICFTVAKMP